MENSKRIKSAMVLRKCTAPISSRMVASQLCGCTDINNPFRNYKPEGEKEILQSKSRGSTMVLKLERLFTHLEARKKEFLSPTVGISEFIDDEKYYKLALKLAGKLDYTSSDISYLALTLPKFEGVNWFGEKAGFFLSALINRCDGKDFLISLANFPDELISGLGFHNTKNIVVMGNVCCVSRLMKNGTLAVKGDEFEHCGTSSDSSSSACGMTGGTLIIEGNVERAIGRGMKGGIAIINGNVRSEVGKYLTGGTIIVKGNAGSYVGSGMHSGTIRLEGKYDAISDDIEGGNLFHKGKLIVKNGKRLK